MSTPPLHGIRVVEFAGIGPGPFAGMMLADHGAEVIRIDRGARGDGIAIANRDPLLRNRKSIALDLKKPESIAAVRRIVAQAPLARYRPEEHLPGPGITDDAVSWKMTEDAWDEVLDVNLKGSFAVARAAARNAASTSSRATTAIMPTPKLNTRRISSRPTCPARCRGSSRSAAPRCSPTRR